MSYEKRQAAIVACRRCPRLRDYGIGIAREKRRAFLDWDYWGRPVPDFGDPQAALLIVGLAPAAHGAHRTGRMFTGDRSGDWLYAALHRCGIANQPTSTQIDDGLELRGALITAVCHCAPPDNRPSRQEQVNCQDYLEAALTEVPRRVVVCLGQIAWNACFRIWKQRGLWTGARPKFTHGAEVAVTGQSWCLGCYHPSQQNTFTGRLTEPMLDALFARALQRRDAA